MASRPQIFMPIILALLVCPTLAAEFTYKEYAKASENWRRFGISRYMAAVAQPDEEPPTQLGRLFRDETQRTVYLSSRWRDMSKPIPTIRMGQ
jgi:hypothetical protein